MAHWNKVSPASPYLVNVSSVGEGPVRVAAVRSVGLHWILAVGVSFKGICSLIYGGTSSISSFVWVYGKVRFLQPSGLVVEDCDPALLLGVCPQPMFHLRLFDLVVRCGWLLWSSKLWLARAFAGGPVLYCLFSVCFKLRQPSIDGRKKTTSMSFTVFLFCTSHVRRVVSLLY